MTLLPSRSLLCPTLVGRDGQRDAVRAVVEERAREHVAVLIGDAGIGKSAVSRAALREVERTVLEGRATPDGAPLRALSEIAIAAVAAGARADDPGLAELRAGLTALLPGAGGAVLGGSAFPLLMAEALLALLATLERPTTVVLDDLHWADDDSLDAVERLCDRVATRPVTIVLLTRPSCRAENLSRRLGARRVAAVVDLDSLEAGEIAEMAADCLGGPPPVGVLGLLDAAEGHPYLVEELLKTACDVGALASDDDSWSFDPHTRVPPPATLAESVAMRLDQLPPDIARAIAIAASLGEGVPVEGLQAAAGLGNTSFRAVIRAGAEAQLLDASSTGLRFRHALGAEATAGRLLPIETRDAAARALAAIVSDPDVCERMDPAALGTLAARAGDDESAARWHLEAARRYAHHAAVTAAITELDLALERTSDPDLATEIRVDRVELLALSGRESEALAQADVAAAGPGGTTEDAIRLDIARARCADPRRVRSDAINRAMTTSAGSRLEARVAATAGLLAVDAGDHAAAADHANRALVLATDDPTARCQALEVLGRVARGRDLDEALSLFSQVAAVAEAHDLALWRARALHEKATITQLRDVDVSDLRQARQAAIDAGAPGLIAAVDFHLAAVLATAFEGAAAVEEARRLHDLCSALEDRSGEAWAWLLIGMANVVSGRWVNAEPALEEATRLRSDDAEITTLARFFRDGLERLLRADLVGAAKGYERSMAELAATGTALSPLPPWYLGPLVLTVADLHGADARRMADRPELQVGVLCHTPFLMALAVAAGRRGDAGEANRLVADADALWNGKPGIDAHRHLARWLAAEHAHRDNWGDPRTWLFDAEAWASALGFDAIVNSCRGELRAMGATPKRRRGTTPVPEGLRQLGLTSREVDVLTLVAQGLTNAAIAEQLHVSAGTVKGYVSQLLTKTGESNRAGLTRVATDHRVRPGS